MKKIGIGLVGCGGRLRGVVRRLMQNNDGRMDVVGIFDPSTKMVSTAREQLNPLMKRFASYQELVRNPSIQWVMIGSWNCFHAEQTIAAFKAGKNVFCEKPLATTLKDCLAMQNAWKKSGRRFAIGFTLRYSAHYWKLKELIDSGVIGKIISLEFNETLEFNHGGYIHGDWRRLVKYAGTHLLEKCSHDIDLVNWMVGSRARRVASFGGLNFFTPANVRHIARIGKDPQSGRDAYDTWARAVYRNPFTTQKDIIDNQVAIIEFENGVRATFHANCNAGLSERRMYILGSEGALRSDVITGQIELKKIGFNENLQIIDTGVSGGHGGGDPVLARLLADCILKGKAPKAGFEDGFNSAVTCFGIDEAMDTGRVVDMKNYWRKAPPNRSRRRK